MSTFSSLLLDVAFWEGLTGVILNVVTTVAIVIGGVWGYMKFVWGRTFRERLETGVSGEIQSDGTCWFVHAVIKVRNVGLAKVPIRQEGSGLRLFVSAVPDLVDGLADEADWNRMATVAVLAGHDWIEPGETIHDHVLFVLQSHVIIPVKLQLHLVSDEHSWVARCVVLQKSPP